MARVRKLAQATAFLGPTACLAGAAACDDGPLTVGEHSTLSSIQHSQPDADGTFCAAGGLPWPGRCTKACCALSLTLKYLCVSSAPPSESIGSIMDCWVLWSR